MDKTAKLLSAIKNVKDKSCAINMFKFEIRTLNMAVALKFALIIYSIICIKKPSFMNANSVCYSFRGELANDINISWIATSLWVNRQENKLHLGQESHVGLALLLLLSGDIELCPGPCMKCLTCSKSIRKNQSQEKCFHCGKLFHLNVWLTRSFTDSKR